MQKKRTLDHHEKYLIYGIHSWYRVMKDLGLKSEFQSSTKYLFYIDWHMERDDFFCREIVKIFLLLNAHPQSCAFSKCLI